MENILVTGSIAYDYLMRFPGSFREHILTESLNQVSLSFLVEEMSKHWGGVAPNIAYTMGLFGLKPRLMGTVGRDFPDYRAWLESAGVDCSTVRQLDHLFTASFFCNTDQENNQISSFYSGAMAEARHYNISDLANPRADLVIISPNDPQAMTNLAAECRAKGLRFVYDPSQQIARMDGETLRRDMQGASIMVVNQYEAHLIEEKSGMSLNDLRSCVETLVITHGKDGSHIYQGNTITEVGTFAPSEIKDPTGAGDAFRAGFITGLAKDLPVKLAAEMGALCATYVLEQVGTQNHRFNTVEFIARFRQTHDDQGQLNALLA